MRILLGFHSTLGHLYPLLPLARAAAGQGHTVAFIGAAEFADVAVLEVPGAEYLVAGATAGEMARALFARDDFDLSNVTPEMSAFLFGSLRPEHVADASIDVAGAWHPDVIVGEEYDAISPLLGAVLNLGWYRHGVGPGQPASLRDRILRHAMPYYAKHGVTYRAPVRHFDPCPPSLKTPDWTTDAPVVPIRTEPHASLQPSAAPDLSTTDGGHVLITLGTVFSDPLVLSRIVESATESGRSIIATRGAVLPQLAKTDDAALAESVQVVDMVPLATLLSRVELVVGAGGSGTVLAAAARAIPMVLCPQGADQFEVTERAVASGFAVSVGSPEEVGPAISEVLTHDRYAAAAAVLADEIAAQPAAADVARDAFGTPGSPHPSAAG